ncbi:DUF3307 domain-containing protein [Patescibacteria group bacterium]
MPITYLIVAHLLSDFTLQPGRLLKFRYKSSFGTLIHVMIFALVAVILLLPYLEFWQTWAVIAGVTVVHFVIDVLKIGYIKGRGHNEYPFPFLIDQAFHLLSIIVGGLVLKNLDVSVSANFYMWIGILIAIYIIAILDIIFLQKPDKLELRLASYTIVFIFFFLAAILI